MQVNQSNYQRPTSLVENESQPASPKTQETMKSADPKAATPKKSKNPGNSESTEDFGAALAAYQTQIQSEAKQLALDGQAKMDAKAQASPAEAKQLALDGQAKMDAKVQASPVEAKEGVIEKGIEGTVLPEMKMEPVKAGMQPLLGNQVIQANGLTPVKSGEMDSRVALSGSVLEQIPQTMNTATSMKTAGAVAGLKPWSTDWVRQGENPMDVKEGSDIKPLFGDKGDVRGAAPTVALQKMLGELSGKLKADFDAVKMQSGVEQGALMPAVVGAETVTPKPKLVSGSEFLDTQAATKKPAQVMPGAEAATVGVVPALMARPNGQDKDQGDFSNGKQELVMKEKLGTKTKGQLSKEDLTMANNRFEDTMAQSPQIYRHDLAALKQPDSRIVVAPLVGQVVKGAMSQDRLSRESLMNIGTGIQKLQAQGGGEMKMRLRPDNLGELVIRVATRGQDVGLQIQASNESAKRVIEDSMVHLKESLANQNLQLHNVETSLIAKTPNADTQFSNSSYNPSSNLQQSDWSGQSNQRQPGQPWNFDGQTQTNQSGRGSSRAAVQSFVSDRPAVQYRESGNSRLDVVA